MASAIFAGIAVIAALAAILVGYWQVGEARKQATEAKRQADAAEDQAKAARDSAASAERQAKAAEKSNQHYESELDLLREQNAFLKSQEERELAGSAVFSLSGDQSDDDLLIQLRNRTDIAYTDIQVRAAYRSGRLPPEEELFFPDNVWLIDRLGPKSATEKRKAIREYGDGDETVMFNVYYADPTAPAERKEVAVPMTLVRRAGPRLGRALDPGRNR